MQPQSSPRTLVMMTMTITAVLMLNHATAQQVAINKFVESKTEFLKNNIIADAPTDAAKIKKLSKMKLHATKDFNSKYKTVGNASWYQIENGLVANFDRNKVSTIVAYNNRGRWLCTINTYAEKDMPKDVRAIVKSIYYDYTIVVVRDVAVPNTDSKTFIVIMQDDNSVKVLRISEGEMEILHDLPKG
jgi:hypothetical protein